MIMSSHNIHRICVAMDGDDDDDKVDELHYFVFVHDNLMEFIALTMVIILIRILLVVRPIFAIIYDCRGILMPFFCL